MGEIIAILDEIFFLNYVLIGFVFLAATKQLYEWFCPSVCLFVCLSVCRSVSVCLSVKPFALCSHYGIIMKFAGVITIDRSDVFGRFQAVTPVLIHKWLGNDAESLK